MASVYVRALEAAHKDLESIKHIPHATEYGMHREIRTRYVQTIFALEKLLRQIGSDQLRRSKRHD